MSAYFRLAFENYWVHILGEHTEMCYAVTCETCKKTTWAGCGAHKDKVLASVPESERCRCSSGWKQIKEFVMPFSRSQVSNFSGSRLNNLSAGGMALPSIGHIFWNVPMSHYQEEPHPHLPGLDAWTHPKRALYLVTYLPISQSVSSLALSGATLFFDKDPLAGRYETNSFRIASCFRPRPGPFWRHVPATDANDLVFAVLEFGEAFSRKQWKFITHFAIYIAVSMLVVFGRFEEGCWVGIGDALVFW